MSEQNPPSDSNSNASNFLPVSKPAFLKTDRVTLKILGMEDIPFIEKWFNDPAIRKYLKPRFPRTPQKIKTWVDANSEPLPVRLNFLIVHNADNQPIGACGLIDINWNYRHAEIYISIGETQYWGQNLAVDANKLILDYAFKELNLHKVYALIFAENERSQKAAIKTGFKPEAVIKDQVFNDGKYQDLVMLSLFQEDYLK
jgi:RimJ/RimL family protein N-acetyltransferase